MIYRWIVCHYTDDWIACPSRSKRWVVQMRRLPNGLMELPDVRCPDCLCQLPKESPDARIYAEWMTFAQ